MNTAIWFAQGMLAAMFVMAGIMKSTQPIEKLQKAMTWTTRYSPSMVRFVGIAELLGAIGVILPWVLNILPVLTPLAACGLATIQLLAIFHHVKHNEKKEIAINIVLIMIAVFVAYGRFQ
jgi:putative oxidoreductase